MAVVNSASEGMVLAIGDIQSMKVADLKKKLKEFGCPITGNKTELIERLQDACMAGKDISASSESDGFDSFDNAQMNFDSTEISEDGAGTLIEDNALNDLQMFDLQASVKSPTTVADNNLNSGAVSKPLKKRAIAKSTGEGTVTEKKVHLNRTHLSERNTSFSNTELNSKTLSPSKSAVFTDDKDETEDKKSLSVKNMSESERLAMRAKRFNVSNAITSNSKLDRTTGTSRPMTLSGTSNTTDLEILKKRAQRFGQSVSTVMKQIEEKEKLLKRKFKFGANVAISATSSLDEQEKKRRRAERFGIS